jgi:predicted HTH transcriptional regulator
MLKYLEDLIAQGEHQELDFKFEISDASKIARSLCAFANTNGGRLLVGVKDNGVIAGIRSDEEIFMVEAASRIWCRPEVNISAKEWQIGKKNILEVYVPPGQQRPHLAGDREGNWKAYVRSGDQNFVANRILLQVWKREGSDHGVYIKFTDAERILLRYLEDHNTITLSRFARISGIKRSKAETILVRFLLLHLIRIHFTENHVFYSLEQNTSET